MNKDQQRAPKAFTLEDMAKAEAEWAISGKDKTWAELRTQTKNKLARDQAYHREFAGLSDAILVAGARKRAQVKPAAALPFRMGDVVEYVGKERHWRGKHHVIEQAQFDGDSFEYSTSRGAWMRHKDFKLVRDADAQSLCELRKSMDDEEDSDCEEA